MTPERLDFILQQCLRRHRMIGTHAHYIDVAQFLGVRPVTLRRWLNGKTPIPRAVEVVMEIFHAWPEVTAASVNKVIAERDEASKGYAAESDNGSP